MMEHLKSIMDEVYSPSHVRVCVFDDVTQQMYKDKIEPDANGLYWGDPRRSISRASALALPSCMQRSTKRPPPSMSSGTEKAVGTTSSTLSCPARFR